MPKPIALIYAREDNISFHIEQVSGGLNKGLSINSKSLGDVIKPDIQILSLDTTQENCGMIIFEWFKQIEYQKHAKPLVVIYYSPEINTALSVTCVKYAQENPEVLNIFIDSDLHLTEIMKDRKYIGSGQIVNLKWKNLDDLIQEIIEEISQLVLRDVEDSNFSLDIDVAASTPSD
jgi:hypothetical protein